MEYLDFEQEIQHLYIQIEKCKEIGVNIDISDTITKLNNKLEETKTRIYKNLSVWQRIQLSRHPNRPYMLFYAQNLCGDSFVEIHGDRHFGDDKAMVGGFGQINGQTICIIGQQKGINTKMRQYRNFGMSNPEGYRKALRLMKLAEKFDIPILTLIDTPGAHCGNEAEERGQAEAIAKNMYQMFGIKVPIICVIIGEGASGGALGIGVGDRIFMLENTWYTVISPENCSSILWRSWDFKQEAADALKLTAKDMLANGLIDKIIPEPLGGAHYDPEQMVEILKKAVLKELAILKKIEPEERCTQRQAKFIAFGSYEEK